MIGLVVAKRITGELDGIPTAGLFVMALSLLRTAVDFLPRWSFDFPPVVRQRIGSAVTVP